MKRPELRQILHAILDKRLYGFSFFFSSGPLLAIGFLIEVIIYYVLNRQMLSFYVLLFIALVLTSGLGSKNYVQTREVPNMGYFRGFLFLIASVLAAVTPFVFSFSQDIYGLFQFSLAFGISTAALTTAILEVTVLGQRVSLRKSIQLDEDFFKKQKKIWEEKLRGFPNLETILGCVDDGRVVVSLFDRGSFNLAVLWSCDVMEEIIDTAADGIIQKDEKKRELFRTEKGSPRRYPLQLKNFKYVHRQKSCRKNEEMTVDKLWDKVRNRIAHYHYLPSFDETFGALIIFISFMENFPETLKAQYTPYLHSHP
jgi:hypothetical protein